MGVRECLMEAVGAGELTPQEAGDLADRFDELHGQLRMALGDDAAAGAAKARLEAELRAEAIERRRLLALTEAARGRLALHLQSHRNLAGEPDVFDAVLNLMEHYGLGGTSSIAGRTKAIVGLAHGRLADVMSTFRRSAVAGRRMNRPAMRDLVAEVLGEPTGKPEVAAMAGAVAEVLEDLRQRFNAAGGAIGRLERYLPQHHDPRALLKAGREEWKRFITPRLDMGRMRDPLTGEALTPARLEQTLEAAFDAVTTDGWSRVVPSGQARGRGALAGQRAEHRFLQFRSADDWLAYDREFGHGDPMKAIFGHINGMARDIAALEILGPNPSATKEWLKQIVTTEAAKAMAGRPSLYDAGGKAAESTRDRLNYLGWRIDAVFEYVRGRRTVSDQLATGFGTVRNLVTSAVLGSASVLAASTDPFLDAFARRIAGLPVTSSLTAATKIFSRSTREAAVRSGVILDDFLNIMGDEARWAGTLGGSTWSQWLADRTMTWSGLQPLTQARRHVFAREFEGAMADQAATPWDGLDPRLQRTMAGFGLDRTAWNVIRATPAHPSGPGVAGMIRPIDVAALADGPALPGVQKLLGIDATDAAAAEAQAREGARRIAEQYLEMILAWTERAVPSGTARARSFATGNYARGTWQNELIEGGLQFKSFLLSFTTLQLQAVAMEGGWRSARGAGYAAGMMISLTLGGALAMQLRHIINGRDPQPVDDPRFWLQAAQTGGGVGLLGDFLFADVNRFGHSIGEQIVGPQVTAAWDLGKLTFGNMQELALGADTRAGREAVNFAGRYTPVLSSLWYMRAAYRHTVLDQLQRLLDPEAERAFRAEASRLKSERNQTRFWRRGDALPSRLPMAQ